MANFDRQVLSPIVSSYLSAIQVKRTKSKKNKFQKKNIKKQKSTAKKKHAKTGL